MTMEEFRLYQEQIFDSFSKRIIKRIAIDIHNAEAALSKMETSFSELAYREKAKLAVEDTYCLEGDGFMRFDLFGFPIEVHDAVLGKALSALPPKRRDVVLLFYFADQDEPQIGQLLNIAAPAVHYRRKTALRCLKKMLEEMDNGD